MNRSNVRHLPIELLERYAMRDLSSREVQRVEKHVVFCPECLDRLEGEVGWVVGVRTIEKTRKMLDSGEKHNYQSF